MPLLAADPTISSNAIAGAHTEQVQEFERYLDKRIVDSEKVRAGSWKRDFTSVEAYEKSIAPKRDELWRLLGGKPERVAPLAPKEESIAEFETHRALRVWLGAFDNVRVYGILLVPKVKEPAPALICIHGMGGSPETVCGLTEKPDYHNNYGLEAAKRGYVVFAPLDVNTQKDRRWLDRKALLVGARLQALEQFKVVRVVDYLASRKDVDPKRIGAYGISWGGRTVMNAAALDPRIGACAISGHFNDLVPKMVTPSTNYTAFIETAEDYAFFYGHFLHFTDADVVSMICPRPVFIEQGRRDRVAHWPMSSRAFESVKAIYTRLGISDRAVYSIFEGPHEIHAVEAFQFFDHWLKGR
jgi:dipeptidyl aminopeptidase/acylaminoacyl peptidase